jgi:hypothetical protein
MAKTRRKKKWDVFISYASEDREDLVRPLAHYLDRLGVKVWFDESSLQIGDSLTSAIGHGLSQSHFGLIILSPAFMKKKWPRNELAALLSIETVGTGGILPVWHGVNARDVAKFNPLLADRVALHSSKGIHAIAHAVYGKVADSGVMSEEVGPLSGAWSGESGRLNIRHQAERIVGDYDWFGEPWVGSIAGTFSEDLLLYDWNWTLDERHGNGFFLYLVEDMRSVGVLRLSGAWWFEDVPYDVDQLVDEWRKHFKPRYVFPEDFQKELGVHRWSFARELRGEEWYERRNA